MFAANLTRIGFRRGTFLRCYMYDFIQLFAPHLTRERVQRVEQAQSVEEVEVFVCGFRVACFNSKDDDIKRGIVMPDSSSAILRVTLLESFEALCASG